jgi:hypothetical protein
MLFYELAQLLEFFSGNTRGYRALLKFQQVQLLAYIPLHLLSPQPSLGFDELLCFLFVLPMKTDASSVCEVKVWWDGVSRIKSRAFVQSRTHLRFRIIKYIFINKTFFANTHVQSSAFCKYSRNPSSTFYLGAFVSILKIWQKRVSTLLGKIPPVKVFG